MMNSFRFGFEAMGCGCEVVAVCSEKGVALSAAEAAIQEIMRIEHKYSRYRTDSVVSRINEQAGSESVVCDKETTDLLRYAATLYEQSNGLFDVTSGVLRRVWDFNKPQLPGDAELDEALELVGWEKVEFDLDSVRLTKKGMEIDMGGIGKEYAADRAAGVMHGKGIRYGYVNLAGDIRVVGAKPDGEPWAVGVREPRSPEKIFASFPLTSGALATSGDYEQYVEVDGRRYCHILDPRTGYPVDYWRSITVVAPTAIAAGSHTTIAMLKGPDGLDYLAASGLMYLAVDQSGQIYQRN
ncbi:MAG: FAD:protein FMN transferase [Chlorobiaceae bacterium]|nr:FAD:protein FMN transferase [Chlorobiaceae bacterium]